MIHVTLLASDRSVAKYWLSTKKNSQAYIINLTFTSFLLIRHSSIVAYFVTNISFSRAMPI